MTALVTADMYYKAEFKYNIDFVDGVWGKRACIYTDIGQTIFM